MKNRLRSNNEQNFYFRIFSLRLKGAGPLLICFIFNKWIIQITKCYDMTIPLIYIVYTRFINYDNSMICNLENWFLSPRSNQNQTVKKNGIRNEFIRSELTLPGRSVYTYNIQCLHMCYLSFHLVVFDPGLRYHLFPLDASTGAVWWL